MSAWLEAYEQLDADAQERVRRWIHLNQFIAATLKIPFEEWIEKYVGGAMESPFDYRFMEATLPGQADLGLDGATFTREVDPALAAVSRVPVRAQNNLGRLSPDLQDAVALRLEKPEADPVKVPPGDVVHLQKLFPKEKALQTLKRKDFRTVELIRDGDEIALRAGGGQELVRVSVHEFGAVMRRANL